MSAAPSPQRVANCLEPAVLRSGLRSTRLGGNLHHFAEVASTSDLALAAAQAGIPYGVWIADAQTAGRGRGGHSWHSAPGAGLYVSVLWTPQLPAATLQLSLAAGLAAWQAIRDTTGLTVDIRWPNDLVTRPAVDPQQPARKLGGVLVETAIDPATAFLRYAIIGVGINVAHETFPSFLATEATSLRLEGWSTPDRQPLVLALLRQLDLHLHTLEEHFAQTGTVTSPHLLARLAEASTWLDGKRVHVPEDGGYTGTTSGLDPQGFLRVHADDGTTRTVRSGGVRAWHS